MWLSLIGFKARSEKVLMKDKKLVHKLPSSTLSSSTLPSSARPSSARPSSTHSASHHFSETFDKDTLKDTLDILLIDDQKMVLDALAALLTLEGHSVRTCKDACEAIKLLETESCNLILCDLIMPEINGLTVLKTAREIAPHIPFVLMSGYAKQREYEQAKALGVLGFLPKPFTLSEFYELLNKQKRRLAG